MDRFVVSISPLILLALLSFTTWYLAPARLGHFTFWIAATALTISSLIAPFLTQVSAFPQEVFGFWGLASLAFAVFASILLALYVISFQVWSANAAVREHVTYFRLSRLRRTAFFSVLFGLFFALSVPSSAFATSSSVFIGAWGISFGVLATRDILHEEGLYLSHLIQGYLGKDLSDEQLSFLYQSLSALQSKLDQSTGEESDSNITVSQANRWITTTVSEKPIEAPEIGLDRLPPRGWIQGALTHRDILKKETFHLYSGAKGSSSLPAQRSLEKQPDWNFTKYKEMLDEHQNLNQARTNLNGVVASPQLKLVQFQLRNLANTPNPIVFMGEKGVGKSFFASYALRLRGCTNIVVLSTDQVESKRPLLNNIRELIESGKPGEVGVIIEDMHNLSFDTQSDIWELAASHSRSNQIAITGRSGQEFDLDIRPDFLPYTLFVPPLREREQDLFLLALKFIDEASIRLGMPISKISISAIDQLYSARWLGNCDELSDSCFQAVKRSQEGTIGSLNEVVDEVRS